MAARAPLRLLAAFFICAGFVAAAAEGFMWHWNADTLPSADIRARGPFLWAIYAPLAIFGGAAGAGLAVVATSRGTRGRLLLGGITTVLVATTVVGLAFIAPETLYLGAAAPQFLGRFTGASVALAEMAGGVAILWRLRQVPPAA